MYTASTWRRILAFLVDHLVSLIFFMPIWLQMAACWFQGEPISFSIHTLILCCVLEFSFRWYFVKLMGGTLGMLMFSLRLSAYSGPSGTIPLPKVLGQNLQPAPVPLTWMQSFLRVLADHFSIFFGSAFFAVALFRFDRRHLSDWVAETQVQQFSPRSSLPGPRWALGSFLFLYFFLTGFQSAYRLIQRSEWDKTSVTIHAPVNHSNGLESGFE